MEIDGGSLDIKVETENYETHARISAERLRELVHRIGGRGDHFLIVQRIPDRPGMFIQVAHEPGGVYEFQHRTGSVPHMWVTEVTDPDLVADVMARWARQEEDWDAGVTWQRDELPAPEEVPPPDPEVAAQAERHVREMLADGYLGIEKIVRETVYLVEDRLSPAQARPIVERLWLMGVPPVRAKPRTGGGSRSRRAGPARPTRTGWSGRSPPWSRPGSSHGRTSPAAVAAGWRR